MTKFGEFTTALRFREAVTQIAEHVVDRMRPTYRYATVQAIVGRKITVRFPGETSDVVVSAGSIIPSAIGQTVRIAGVGGERYVSDVLGLSRTDKRLTGADTRLVNDTPTDVGHFASMSAPEFKNGPTIGLPGVHYAVVTVSPWGEDSGGGVHQIAYGNADAAIGDVWHRYGLRSSGWGGWERVGGGDATWREIGLAGQPAYLNSHSFYDYGGKAGFRRDASGMVSIQGLITKAANASTVFSLPVGYRPKVNLIWSAHTSSGLMEARLETNGNLFYNNTGAAGWASAYVTYLAGN